MQDDRNTIIYTTSDPLETWVRLVCGGLFGLAVSLCAAWRLDLDSRLLATTLVLAGTGLCAWLALRYGDDFWRNALESFRLL